MAVNAAPGVNGSGMDREESLQIELIRVLCILTMMWVHVSPGLSIPSYVNGGPMDTVGLVLGRTLGRISVTTLSFISGYLFWRTAIGRPARDVARRLIAGILLPMLVWSALFLILAALKEVLVAQPASALGRVEPGLWGLFNAWTGFAGPQANLSLFFLRDLLVATVLLRLAAPLISSAPLLAVLLALGLVALPQTEPILFRPNILLFMVLGAAAARGNLTITRLSRPRLALTLGLVLTLLTVAMARTGLTVDHHLDTLHDLLRRAGIGLLMLALTGVLVRSRRAAWLAPFGRHGFLAYLSHVPLLGIAWPAWQRLAGAQDQPAYLIFYLVMPVACLAMATLGGRVLDLAPVPLQILLRGKSIAAPPKGLPLRPSA